jgi:Complex I intermediate-associated protein 30 (CIA30)
VRLLFSTDARVRAIHACCAFCHHSMDDGVMGGVSSSTLVYDKEEQCLNFMGEVSLDRNGGFARYILNVDHIQGDYLMC